MAKKGKKATPQEAQAGQRNLQKWLGDHPEGPDFKHGAYAKVTKRRYRDGRYREAKELKAIVARLTEDIGGERALNEGQRLLLGVIRSKFLVCKQISQYVADQEGIVDKEGDILACLKSFCTYTEGMRRAILAFYGLGDKKKGKAPNLNEYLRTQYKEDKADA